MGRRLTAAERGFYSQYEDMLSSIDVAHTRASMRGLINVTIEQSTLNNMSKMSAGDVQQPLDMRALNRMLSDSNLKKLINQVGR